MFWLGNFWRDCRAFFGKISEPPVHRRSCSPTSRFASYLGTAFCSQYTWSMVMVCNRGLRVALYSGVIRSELSK